MAGERASKPGDGKLVRRGRVAPGDRRHRVGRDLAPADGRPGQKGKPVLLAEIDEIVRATVEQVVAVLYRDDLSYPPGAEQLVAVDVGDADVTDLALPLQVAQRADRLLVGHLGVGPMKLVEVDALEAQGAQAAFECRAQVFGSSVGGPLVGGGPQQSALGGDHETVGIRIQRLGDELLADPGSVAVGRVDEVHAQLDRATQHAPGFGAVRRVADDALAGDTHRPEPEPMHRKIAADGDAARRGGVQLLRHRRDRPSLACFLALCPARHTTSNAASGNP